MRKRTYKNLILDLDGCLIDSHELQCKALTHSYREIVDASGKPDIEKFFKYTGDSIRNVFLTMGYPLKMIESYKEFSSSNINLININKELIYKIIISIKQCGGKVAICTGKDRKRTIEILEYFNLYNLFDGLVCSDDVINTKPNPESLYKAISLLGVNKEECIYIGDGENDMLCARNAGMSFALTTWFEDNCKIHDCIVLKSVDELKCLMQV